MTGIFDAIAADENNNSFVDHLSIEEQKVSDLRSVETHTQEEISVMKKEKKNKISES